MGVEEYGLAAALFADAKQICAACAIRGQAYRSGDFDPWYRFGLCPALSAVR
jgi:hypothetical protein